MTASPPAYSPFLRASVLLAALIALSAFITGCGGDPAPDLPGVSGSVFTQEGSVVSTGMIEFRNLNDRTKRSTASIDPQGRFSLTTGVADARYPGVYPGEYEVAVYEPVTFVKRPAVESVTVPTEGTDDLRIVVGAPSM